MLLALKKIMEIENFLQNKIDDSTILDYRISFKFNTNIDVFVLLTDKNQTIYSDFKSRFKSQFSQERIDISIVTLSDCRMDDFYQYLFSQDRNPDKVDAKLKRRLDNLIDYENH
jgi:hypothetical protein